MRSEAPATSKAPRTLLAAGRFDAPAVGGTRARSCGRAVALTFLGAFLMMAVSAGSASAAQTRPFIGAFGSFEGPRGLAVDQASGDVWVADSARHRVEKFDAEGTFILSVGKQVNRTAVEAAGTEAEQNLCTAASGDTCQPGEEATTPGSFSSPAFLAVDNAAGGEADLYVADVGDNLVTKFDAEGELITGWGSGGQLSGDGSETFTSFAGIAVDSAGTLSVFEVEPHTLFKFTQAGAFSEAIETPRGTEPDGLAVDPAGNFFKINGNDTVEKFGPTGADIGQITGESPQGQALDDDPATGDLYLATRESLQHFAFNGAGEVIQPGGGTCATFEDFGPGCPPTDSLPLSFTPSGVAFASTSGRAYLSDPAEGQVEIYGPLSTLADVVTGAATARTKEGATLNGTVDPEGIELTECLFEYGETEAYGQIAACSQSPGAIGSGTKAVPVSAAISGLSEGATYHYRLVAANHSGSAHGADATFRTTTPPLIGAAAATGLSLEGADLVAQLDPNDGATTYRFEYGPTAAYGLSTPEAILAEGEGEFPISQHVTGLTPDTTYHFRLVATNSAGTTTGTDHTFVYTTLAPGLPDGRAYEMVTPVQKNGALIGQPLLGQKVEVSADGSRVILGAIQCLPGSLSCQASRQVVGDAYSFRRTAAGWVSESLGPPAAQFAENTEALASVESGMALFSMPTSPGSEDDWYARQSDGSFVDVGPVTPPGTRGIQAVAGELWAATADLSHVVYNTNGARWPFDATAGEEALYEYAGTGNSHPFLVGVGGPNSGPGSTDLISVCGSEFGGFGKILDNALSADGRTVFFSADECGSGSGANAGIAVPVNTLYARIDGELPDARTVLVSGRSPTSCTSGECQASPPRAAQFVGASSDGSRVFFASTQQLTDQASQDPSETDHASGISGCSTTESSQPGCNLYLFEGAQEQPLSGENLIDVSVGAKQSGGPRVQGVIAFSPDGSHVYFVAKGVLTGANAEAKAPVAGQDNLYAYQRDPVHPGGHLAFVAGLPESDQNRWASLLGPQASDVTPDGRYLVFTSHGALTADDTAGEGPAQVYRYDATAEQLTRVSVGAAGFNDDGNAGLANATIVRPSDTGSILVSDFRSNPTMSDDGSRVFFMSPVGLTPGALDDVEIPAGAGGNAVEYAQNVYEWEQDDTEVDGRVVCEEAGGCVSLISDGRDANDSANESCEESKYSAVCLLGTDAGGENVFFTTADPLVSADTDTQQDVYDARVGGGFAEATLTAPCQGESCKGGATVASPAQTHASAVLSGPGNVKPSKCKHGFVRKGGKCVKQKQSKKKRHQKNHKNSNKKKASHKNFKRDPSHNRGGQK
jgi:hypothetical protein